MKLLERSLVEFDTVLNEFKNGVLFDLKLCDKIHKDMCHLEEDYIQTVQRIKNTLNKYTYDVYRNVVVVNLPDLKETEYITLIRFINLIHKGKKFIVLNSTLVFIPEVYHLYDKEAIKDIVSSYLMKLHRREQFKKLVSRWVEKLYSIKNLYAVQYVENRKT